MDDLEKALEQIVRAFLLNETIPLSSKDNESTKNVEEQEEINKNNSTSAPAPASGPSVVVPQLPDDEFVSNLYQCLAERGIIREVHAFLRQRLVEILKGSFPHVVVSGCDGNFNPTVMKLLDDFLCCHKLLFTYSVLVTELDNKLEIKQDFGKIYSRDAEALLDEMGIRKDTELSRKILRQYSEKEHASLLECIIGVASWGNGNETSSWWDSFGADLKQGNGQLYSSDIDASLKKKTADYESAEKLLPSENLPQLENVEQRLFLMLQDMERDKESEIRLAMAKFRQEETGRIRDEIVDRMKFEFLSKEKELLRNYDDRVKHMKHLLDREKEIWSLAKAKKEKELFDQRQDLIKLMEHVQEKRIKLQEALAHTRNRKLNSASNSQSSECSSADAHKSRHAKKKTRTEDDNSFCESRNVNHNPAPALMKSIKLESTINRLKEENERLKRKVYSHIHSQCQGQGSHNQKHRSRNYSNRNSSTDNDTSQSVEAVVEGRHSHSRKKKEINNDKIALLQYTVEQQTEEVEKLKRHLKQDHSTPSDKFVSQPTEFQSQAQPINEIEPNPSKSSTTQDNTDLETFLAESKRRFAAIEKKAELVGSSLREVFKRKNGSTYSGIGDSSSCCTRIAGFAEGDGPPLVPKLPSNLKQSAHNSHTGPGPVVTQSLLAPRFMSTATSSIDQALKSFLMNQTEDIYTGSALPEIKIPESPHVSRLKISNAMQTIQSIEHIRASNKRKVQNQNQMRKHSIPTPASEFEDPVSVPIEIPVSRQSQTGETEHSKPESVRLFNDSTSNLEFPISLKPQATTVSNSIQVVPENESNVLAMDKETIKIRPDGAVQNQTQLEKPSPASSTNIPENNPQELQTVLTPPTSKVPELPSLSPLLLKKLELQRSTISAMINATVAQSLSSLPFLNQSDDDSAEKDMTPAVGLVHTESHVPSLKAVSQKKTKELYDTSSEDSQPESHDNSNSTTIESPGVALSAGSKSEPAIETALKQTRVQIASKSDFNVNVKPTLDTAASSGALIQYKVPSPFSEDASESRDLGIDQPLKSSKVSHRDLELGTLGDVLPSPSSKPKSEGVKKKSHSSENSLSFSEISHADVHGDGDAFEMMTEEDFWAL